MLKSPDAKDIALAQMNNALSLSFTSAQVQRLSGISVMRMHYWVQTGIAEPSVAAGRGRGAVRRWSFTDVLGLRVLTMLRDEGVPLQRVRKLLPLLQQETGEGLNLKALARARLVVLPDGDVALARNDRQLLSLLRAPGQGLLVPVVMLGLEQILRDVESRMLQQRGADSSMNAKITALKSLGAWILEKAG
jgi:DNA-binding transcriptional MerR regulator